MIKFFILVIIISHYAYASIGEIILVDGKAMLNRNNKIYSLNESTKIEEKDTITTIGNSQVKILLDDNTSIILDKNSILKINNYNYEKNNAKADFLIVGGKIRFLIGNISIDNIKYKTDNSSITIKCKEMVIQIDENKEKFECAENNSFPKDKIPTNENIPTKNEFEDFDTIVNPLNTNLNDFSSKDFFE